MNGAQVTVYSHGTDFTTVSNVYLRDKDLSLKAKGLMTVVLSLSHNSNWDFTIKGLVETLKEGEVAIYAAINELKTKGYCKTEIERNEKKQVTRLLYFFDEKSNPTWIEKS